MASTRVKLNSAGIQKLLESGEVRRDLTERAERVLSAAESLAPVVSGNYRDGLAIIQDTTDRAVVRVAGTAPHSHLVEANHGVLARALDSGR